VLALWALCGFGTDARAIDIEPSDYTPLPAGTNLVALYSVFADYGPLNIARGPTIREATGAHSVFEILRYIYYGAIEQRSYALQLVVPTGTLHGEIAGQKLPSDGGLGDILVAAGVSLLPHPQPTYNVVIVSYTSLPTGSYAPDRVLNLGANRVSEDVQFGYLQEMGKRVWFDFAADAVVYGADSDAGSRHQTLQQQPTYQLQSWLSYSIDPASLVSAGYSALLGGTQTLDGVQNGLKTQSQQVRLAYSRFLSPSFQLLGSIAHDINVVGGFKQNFGLTIRVVRLF
jgi:hypothetical protein